MPLAEATHDQTAVRGAGVEPRQHAATPELESSLEIARTARDLHGVCDELSALRGCRLEPRLGSRFIGERRTGKQREPYGGAKLNARAVAVG